jgi:transposase-like protein
MPDQPTDLVKQDQTPDKVNKMTLKKAQAIELWQTTHGHISNICRSIGISRTTFYEWMQDPAFAQQLVDAEAELNDEVRDVLINKAASGDMTAVIFYLKSRHPDFKQKEEGTRVQNNYIQVIAKEKSEFE